MPPQGKPFEGNMADLVQAVLSIAHAIDNAQGLAGYANAGSAGGTFYYFKINGIKIVFGQSGAVSTNTGPVSYNINLPSGFFDTVYGAVVSPSNMSAWANQWCALSSFSTTVASVYAWAPGAGSQRINMIAFGV